MPDENDLIVCAPISEWAAVIVAAEAPSRNFTITSPGVYRAGVAKLSAMTAELWLARWTSAVFASSQTNNTADSVIRETDFSPVPHLRLQHLLKVLVEMGGAVRLTVSNLVKSMVFLRGRLNGLSEFFFRARVQTPTATT